MNYKIKLFLFGIKSYDLTWNFNQQKFYSLEILMFLERHFEKSEAFNTSIIVL